MTTVKNDDGDVYVPFGYQATFDCMVQPRSWNVPGMIADIAENIRRGNDVPEGQVLAALDLMMLRLKECRQVLVCADSELSAIGHNRAVDKTESNRISGEARRLCDVLKGF